MYNFYYGSREKIAANPKKYLLGIKRTLPRWANPLPDSEYLALYDLLEARGAGSDLVMVETGVGASTLMFLHFAMQTGGRLLSWDINSSKGSFIRSVAADTLEQYHNRPISGHWTFVSSASLSPHSGMPILAELVDHIDVSLHDSEHTWRTISGEVEAVVPLMRDGGIICVDDANQTYLHTYEPIVNVTRRKLGLKPIDPITGNQTVPHYEAIPPLLGKYFTHVADVGARYKADIAADPYYSWYDVDRRNMSEVGMERFDDLPARFGVWRVSGRKSSRTG
jgi:hypothetical protein